MATTWEQVVTTIESTLKGAVSYAKVARVGSIAEYLANATGQSIFDAKDVLILVSPPEGPAEDVIPKIGGYFIKRYDVEVAVVAKTDPTAARRLTGKGPKKGIFEVRRDVVAALEHSNLGGLVDNKAGANFESGWARVDSDSRTFTAYTTIYTVHKTEK